MVGSYFYIHNKRYSGFLIHKISEEAEKYGDFLVDPKSHADLFDEKFGVSATEYYKFPRGRVVFNLVENKHVLYIDRCIVDKAVEIADLFNISNQSYII